MRAACLVAGVVVAGLTGWEWVAPDKAAVSPSTVEVGVFPVNAYGSRLSACGAIEAVGASSEHGGSVPELHYLTPFQISKIPMGRYNLTVTCSGDQLRADTSFLALQQTAYMVKSHRTSRSDHVPRKLSVKVRGPRSNRAVMGHLMGVYNHALSFAILDGSRRGAFLDPEPGTYLFRIEYADGAVASWIVETTQNSSLWEVDSGSGRLVTDGFSNLLTQSRPHGSPGDVRWHNAMLRSEMDLLQTLLKAAEK